MAKSTTAGTAHVPQGSRGMPWSPIFRELGDPEKRTAYYMVMPALLLILIIAFTPIVYSFVLSFQETIPGQSSTWVGFDNYVNMFQDPDFLTGLTNTAVFTVASVSFEFSLGLWLATALNRGFRGQGTMRSIALMPWAFPTVISAVMWRLMYQDGVGIMAYIAETIGLYTKPILTSEGALMVAAILVDVWKTTPFMAILLLAGLQTIPEDVYEAARVDGATPKQSFWRITFPLLKGSILVALLFRTLDAWRIYDLFWAMSDRQLDSLSTYVFTGVRISQLDFSLGMAASVFIFLSSLAIAFIFIGALGVRANKA